MPASRLWAGEHRDVAGAVVIEIFHPPFPGAVAVFDYGNLPVKWDGYRHVIEALTVSKPRPLGGISGGYHFLEASRLVRHAALSHTLQKPASKSPTPSPNPRPSATEEAEEKSDSTPSPQPEATRAQTESTPPAEKAVPSPTAKKKRHWFFFGKRDDDDSIVVQKSGAEAEKDMVPAPGGGDVRWQYLTPAVRKAIDEARVTRNRWKYIIVHNSGTRQGNARIFDYYHRYVRRMPNGLAYHFVIGNGTSSGNGQIEIGNRWTRQLNGGHVHSDYLNYISVGICLVGDFNRDLPTKAEYEALDELIRYLRRRVGKVDGRYSIVRGHKEINPRPTDCPGNRFPLNWLHRSFPD